MQAGEAHSSHRREGEHEYHEARTNLVVILMERLLEARPGAPGAATFAITWDIGFMLGRLNC